MLCGIIQHWSKKMNDEEYTNFNVNFTSPNILSSNNDWDDLEEDAHSDEDDDVEEEEDVVVEEKPKATRKTKR